MSTDQPNSNELIKGKVLEDLMNDLKKMGINSEEEFSLAEDNLDVIVDQAIQGIDIRSKFPNFYTLLLQSKKLRQQFIDAVTVALSVDLPLIDPFMIHSRCKLDFLKQNLPQASSWPVYLSQTKFQLTSLFLPVNDTFRSSNDIFASPQYTLLRKEFILDGTTYFVLMEGELAEQNMAALKVSLNLMTQPGDEKRTSFPIQVNVQWGNYAAETTFNHEAKQPLPDIALSNVFSEALNEVKSDLFLTLTPITH